MKVRPDGSFVVPVSLAKLFAAESGANVSLVLFSDGHLQAEPESGRRAVPPTDEGPALSPEQFVATLKRDAGLQ